jgi:hypothetical protein
MATTAMDAKTLANVAQYLIGARREEAVRFNEIHEWVKNRVISIYVPAKARQEYRQIVEQSKFNILPLLISSLANEFYIDGYRPARKGENAAVWDEVWQPNRMDARQAGIWRPAIEFGTSYVTVLPGKIGDRASAVVKPWSPRRLTALYDDPLSDEWPRYAMSVGTERPEFGPDGVKMVTPITIYDDEYKYEINVPSMMMVTRAYSTDPRGSVAYTPMISVDATNAVVSEHGLGVCPVVRFMQTWGELDDGPEGVVYPMIPAQLQLNQTTYSLGMAEFFSAFIQKYVTGLEVQEDENGNPIEPFNVAVDKLLQAEDPETKFGSFPQTDLKGYLDSRDKTLLYVATARQLPPHKLVVGDSVSNVSAEALAALQDGHMQDVAAWKVSLGESAEQVLRLGGKAMGDTVAWEDTSGQVRWRDTTPRSLAQIADALGKLATMLEVPPEALWERIPDVTDQDLEIWKDLRKENDSITKFGGLINDARTGRTSANPGAPTTSGGRS